MDVAAAARRQSLIAMREHTLSSRWWSFRSIPGALVPSRAAALCGNMVFVLREDPRRNGATRPKRLSRLHRHNSPRASCRQSRDIASRATAAFSLRRSRHLRSLSASARCSCRRPSRAPGRPPPLWLNQALCHPRRRRSDGGAARPRSARGATGRCGGLLLPSPSRRAVRCMLARSGDKPQRRPGSGHGGRVAITLLGASATCDNTGLERGAYDADIGLGLTGHDPARRVAHVGAVKVEPNAAPAGTSDSPRQASAQLVHVVAQSKHS